MLGTTTPLGKSITIVNKKDHKNGPNSIFIGRGTPLGNPFTHLPLGATKAEFKVDTRDESIDKYEDYLINNLDDEIISNYLNEILEIIENYGEVFLVCHCKPKRCHGDVIKKLIESGLIRSKS